MKTLIVTMAALLGSTSAYAQTVPAPAPEAPAASTNESEPGDIIVTAQKRAQSLQSVSAAVSAVGADRLATNQINSLQDLQTIIPSVNFGSDFNQAKIFIRGVGANTSTTGSSTGVALHVDGAYVARAEAQLTSLFDLERVEVLRGPQGTLYGRNAVGGSVNLITAKPTEQLAGYARLTYGNYNNIIAEAAIGGKIIDGVRARLAVRTENRDGFGKNPVSGAGVDDLSRRNQIFIPGRHLSGNEVSNRIDLVEVKLSDGITAATKQHQYPTAAAYDTALTASQALRSERIAPPGPAARTDPGLQR